MSATQTLLQRLRALSGYEHSDFSVGAEAADEIERLQSELAAAPVQPEPVAWRLRNTSFRQPHFEFYATEKQAKDRQEAFNMSVDDGGLYDLTPLYASPPLAQPALTLLEQAAERVRDTIIVEGESPEKLREAIYQRVADLGKPTAQPAQAEPAEFHNPWRASLENCISGDNYLRASEYRDLIEELDDMYRLRAAQPQREPQPMLTGEQIKRALVDVDGIVNPDDEFWLEVGRAIERLVLERKA